MAEKLRQSDERHEALEKEQKIMHAGMTEMATKLDANTSTTDQIKADTESILDATKGIRWLGHAGAFLAPFIVIIGGVFAMWKGTKP